MNKDTIRRIDAVLGNVLCFLLTGHRRLADAFRRTPARPLRKVLFLKLIEQGATVIAAPALQKAVDRVGRENVYFCVFPENRFIVDLLDVLPAENVLEIRHDTFPTFVRDALAAVRRIREADVDTVIDMEFLARAPAILAYLTGADRRVGLDRFTAEGPYRGDLMTHRVQYNPYLHTSLAYLLLVEALDLDPRDLPLPKVDGQRPELAPPRFVPTPEESARVTKLLEDGLGASRGPLVILNANTGDLLPRRLWPGDRFVALGVRTLVERPGTALVLTGAPSERPGAEALRDAILAAAPTPGAFDGRVLCLAGKTSLRDLFVLYTLCDVIVTSDSGPGHFASMTDIENIVLFGPETPQLFGPMGPHGRVKWARLACSPCVNPYNHRFSPCENNVCMQRITVDEVHSEVGAALEARQLSALSRRTG